MKRISKVLCLMLALSVSWLGFAQSTQNKAQNLFDSGKYEEAAQLFDMTASMTQDANEKAHLYDMAKKSRSCLSLLRKANSEYAAEKWQQAKQNYQALLGGNYNPKDPFAKKRVAEITATLEKLAAEKARQAELERQAAERERQAAEARKAAELAAKEEARKAEQDWKKVDKLREDDLNNYLSKHPRSAYAKEANQCLQDIYESREWEKLETKDSYQAFLQKYPKGKYADQAQQVLTHWDERVLWGQYLKKNTESGYQEYLTKYPSGIFAADARKHLNQIKEDRYWENAVKANTIKEYNVFTVMFPSGVHYNEAKKRIAELELVKRQEKSLVDRILTYPTKDQVDSFIAQHPGSEWNDELSDRYAQYVCTHINLNDTSKKEFKLARDYAKTRETKSKIDEKEKAWKEATKQRTSNAAVKVAGYTLGGALIVGGVVAAAAIKKAKASE